MGWDRSQYRRKGDYHRPLTTAVERVGGTDRVVPASSPTGSIRPASDIDDVGVDLPSVGARRAWRANVSLTSTAPMSARLTPARINAFSAAATGAKPNRFGSIAVTALPAIRTSGSPPMTSAASLERSSGAEAPSLSEDALPAVTVPTERNGGSSTAGVAAVASGRIDLSMLKSVAGTAVTRSS